MKTIVIMLLQTQLLIGSLGANESYNQFKDDEIEFTVEDAKGPNIYFPDPVGDKKRQEKKRQMEQDFAIKTAKNWKKIWSRAHASWLVKNPPPPPTPKVEAVQNIALTPVLPPQLETKAISTPNQFAEQQQLVALQRSKVANLAQISDGDRLDRMKKLFSKLKIKKLKDARLAKTLSKARNSYLVVSGKSLVVPKAKVISGGRAPASIGNGGANPSRLKAVWQKFLCSKGFNRIFKSAQCH